MPLAFGLDFLALVGLAIGAIMEPDATDLAGFPFRLANKAFAASGAAIALEDDLVVNASLHLGRLCSAKIVRDHVAKQPQTRLGVRKRMMRADQFAAQQFGAGFAQARIFITGACRMRNRAGFD